ncbi:MAG: hypothetical protein A3F10_02955 [Coxiella sp. RIFCSPHIGHO2_12_FULL_42_15]|nr:MAG: hypothetical protein A3F10_02955 [Coxiella sp. RIFCSPHIGHO2_12_FULL_42_15]
MKISLIAAMAKRRVIGKNNQMPWHLPADLQHFKALTLHKPIVMGRNTYESIGRPLPKRRNILLSRQPGLQIPEVEVYPSLDQVLFALRREPEVMVVGGQFLFERTIALARTMYLTFIDLDVEGDTFFPTWDEADWQVDLQEEHAPDSENPYAYRFCKLTRL